MIAAARRPSALDAPVGSRRAGDPKPYDFRGPSQLQREHVRTLQIAYETFGRQFATILTSTLRAICAVDLVSVQQVAYTDYTDALPSPSVLVLTSIDPLPGTAILQLPQAMAMGCIDRLLGGSGEGDQPTRGLTEIESQLMQALAQRVVHELHYAFEGLVELSPAVVGLEANPQFAQVAAPSDVMVVASFEVRLGKHEGVATLAMPFAGLFPVLERVSNSKHVDRRDVNIRSAAVMKRRMHDIPIDVAVQFAPVSLTPTQILGLRIGDVLPLGQPTNRPLQVTSGGVTVAHAVPGSKGKHLACLVVEPPVPQEGMPSR